MRFFMMFAEFPDLNMYPVSLKLFGDLRAGKAFPVPTRLYFHFM